MNSTVKQKSRVKFFCIAVLVVFIGILAIPYTREIFRSLSVNSPFIMGFVKFAFLATVGELLSIRLSAKKWALPSYIYGRAFVWGIIGVVLALMLKIYSSGIGEVLSAGILPGKGSLFFKAFLTSAVMNITFGPVMMGFHKITDKYFELKSSKASDTTIRYIAGAVDWQNFIMFIVLKTIPLFWIPAHTITFMLPSEYQTVMAAFLSIALGVILSFNKK